MRSSLTLDEFHRMCGDGNLGERTELLRGAVIESEKKTPQYCYIISVLRARCERAVRDGHYVRQGGAVTCWTSDSELEPDIAIVRGKLRDHRDAHPTTAEFVIEIAIVSTELDREKAAVYAEAGVPEYWIVIPAEQVIEVYTSPAADGYASMRRHEDVNAALATTVFPPLSILPRELFA